MPDEVAILRSLGFAVFTPRVLPRGLEGRSTAIEQDPDDAALDLPPETRAVLEAFPFYERRWTPTLTSILNEHFEAVVTAFYPECFSSAIQHFQGRVIARCFGREGTANYRHWTSAWGLPDLEDHIEQAGERYIFGQAYPFLAEVEPPLNARHAFTLPLVRPGWVDARRDSWNGAGGFVLLNIPLIGASPYYQPIYEGAKATFAGVPHRIFGHQPRPVADPSVIASPPDDELLNLFASCSAFAYTSSEPRHLHYPPVEALVIGAPVLYLRGSLLDRLVPGLPGGCADLAEMRAKAEALVGGNTTLAAEIRAAAPALLAPFAPEAARAAWANLLGVRS
ncbi:hypothetical protein J8J14_19775 [Roseomonas sp. SSH11]|uniref:Glycosyltransferase family 1 protein n=2 Tax=Pararoseomonas baculiformis TaxID=2820812 RepID=A0ABS4AJ29_9PROT|nr:hypothetical protein [Pararoseomonas baculiformis]